MLSKLLKYEFKSTARIFLPFYVLIIALTLLCRGLSMLANVWAPAVLPSGLFTALYIFSLMGILILSYVMALRRFYSNLIGDEGYLSHTLPVNPWQHIFSKLIVAMVWVIASAAIVLFSVALIFIDKNFLPNILELMRRIFSASNTPYFIIAFEFFVTAIVSLASSILMLYASMSVGQMLNGHKVIGAIAAFFAFYTATQVLIVIIMSIAGAASSEFNYAFNVINNADMVTVMSVFLIVVLVIQSIFGAGYFLITNYAFKRKLNLD